MFLDKIQTATLLGTKSKKQLLVEMPDWLQELVGQQAPSNEEEALLYLNSFAESYTLAAQPLEITEPLPPFEFEPEIKRPIAQPAVDALEYYLKYPMESRSLMLYVANKVYESPYYLPVNYLIPAIKNYQKYTTQKELVEIAQAFGEKGSAVAQMLFPNQSKKKNDASVVSKATIEAILENFAKLSLTKKIKYLDEWSAALDYFDSEMVNVIWNDYQQIKVQNKATTSYGFKAIWFQFAIPGSILFVRYKGALADIFERKKGLGTFFSSKKSITLRPIDNLTSNLAALVTLLKPFKEGNMDMYTFVLAFTCNAVPVDFWLELFELELPDFIEALKHERQTNMADWQLNILHQNLLDQFILRRKMLACEPVLKHWESAGFIFPLLAQLPISKRAQLVEQFELYKTNSFEHEAEKLDIIWSVEAILFLCSKWMKDLYPREFEKKIYRYLPYFNGNSSLFETLKERYSMDFFSSDALQDLLKHRDILLKTI